MFDRDNMIKIVESCGVNVYDTEVVSEFDKRIFRLYITSKEGISLDKCAEVSRILSPIFDVEPPLEGEYTFEVSSPGIERKLTKPEQYVQRLRLAWLTSMMQINKTFVVFGFQRYNIN